MEQKSVLLVEDDYLNRRLSKKILMSSNFTVFEAKNGREALNILNNEIIDIVILDINLGENEQDGILLGQEIYDHHSIPFIYLTAYDYSEIIARAVATSPYSYITKPFKSADLITSIQIALQHKSKTEVAKIVVKHEHSNVAIAQSEIYYIVSEGNYLLIHTDKEVYKLRTTIKQFLEAYSKSNFKQVHRAYIVNTDKIEKFTIKHLTVQNVVIPISKNYLSDFGALI